MTFNPEFMDDTEPATTAENAALLAEVVNLALYGPEDPMGSILDLTAGGVELPSIERGHRALALPKDGSRNVVTCKYDHRAHFALLRGSPDKVHIASLTIRNAEKNKTYDILASSEYDHSDIGQSDLLVQLFDLLEGDSDDETMATIRSLDFAGLPNDVAIEVFEDLPTRGFVQRNIGRLGLQVAELLPDDKDKTKLIARAEADLAEANVTDSALAMEIDMAATIADGLTVRALTAALREDYEPIPR